MVVMNKTDVKALRHLEQHGETRGSELYIIAGARQNHPKEFIRRLEKTGYVESKLGKMGEGVAYLTEEGRNFLKEHENS